MESALLVAPPSGARQALTRHARLLLTGSQPGAFNMALDDALLARAVQTREVVWRVYGWSAPTVSLGRHQIARGHYDLGRARRLGVSFVRRPTGGRAILHAREITYSVTGPLAEIGSLRESYRAINRLLCEALRLHGVAAREAEPASPAQVPGPTPCFESPVTGELVVEGRKLVGSAQVREGGAFLQHGSILVDDDQQVLNELLHVPEAMTPPATLTSILGAPVTIDAFAASLATVLATASGVPPAQMSIDESLSHDVELLQHTRYATEEWTWRR